MSQKINLKPLSDYILIEPVEQETKTASGLVIPDTANKEKPQKGKVLVTGPGKVDDSGKTIPMEVKADDIVWYKKWGGTEIKIEGKEYLILKQEDVLAVEVK